MSYSVMNFIGSAVLTVIAVIEVQWGFILLEAVWALVSLWGIITLLRGAHLAAAVHTRFSEKREGTNFIAGSSPLAKVLAGWVYPSSDPLSFPGCSSVSPLCPPLLLALVQREPPRVAILGN